MLREHGSNNLTIKASATKKAVETEKTTSVETKESSPQPTTAAGKLPITYAYFMVNLYNVNSDPMTQRNLHAHLLWNLFSGIAFLLLASATTTAVFFACETCNQCFRSKEEKDSHELSAHGSSSGTKAFCCKLCDKRSVCICLLYTEMLLIQLQNYSNSTL